jgi:5-methylthioadenosine/S-adenosylhomocysteine deaminase
MSRILLKSGTVITMDRNFPNLSKGDVLLEDDRILAVGPTIEISDAEIIDATNTVVMPGFVNAHIHTWQTCLRGIASDWTISEYLHNMHATIGPTFTPDDIYISNLLGALNQLNSGTTTIVDWCHNTPTAAHSDRAIDALQESGIRALFLNGSPKPDPKPGEKHFSEIPYPRFEIERLSRDRLSARDALVTLGMAILGPAYSIYGVSRQDLQLAREMKMLVSMHVGGGAMVVPDGFVRLADENLFSDKTNIVHGNNLPFDQLRRLIECGATITVTPEVEYQMGFGNCLTGCLRRLGAAPSLGSDIESAVGGDMFNVLRIALQGQRHADNLEVLHETGKAPEHIPVTCQEALEWATIDGAKMIGLDGRIGSLTPGKQADLVMLRVDDLNLFPMLDPVRAVVTQAGTGNVDTVFVAGHPVKRSGKLCYRNLARKKEQLAETSRRILSTVRLDSHASTPAFPRGAHATERP